MALEDLLCIILDTREVSLTGVLLDRLAEESVLVLGTDSRHMPSWIALPWTAHYRQAEVFDLQVGAALPLRKQLWSAIVRRKLSGQAANLRSVGDCSAAMVVLALTARVRSGDPDNVEARAARRYWPAFMGSDFRRHDHDLRNAMLDYGYAVLRAALCRMLCAAGFVAQRGIHHRSVSNAFNLADDILEPYRPIVDAIALQLYAKSPGQTELTIEHRRALASILQRDVFIMNATYSVSSAVEITVESLKHSIKARNPGLLRFPTLDPDER